MLGTLSTANQTQGEKKQLSETVRWGQIPFFDNFIVILTRKTKTIDDREGSVLQTTVIIICLVDTLCNRASRHLYFIVIHPSEIFHFHINYGWIILRKM